MSDTVELENAAIEAKAARERLIATTQELKARLDPAALAEEARDGVRSGARELAESAGEAARRRPGITAGVAAAVLLLVFRRPLRRLCRRRSRLRETHALRRR